MYVLILTLFLTNNSLSQAVIINEFFGPGDCRAMANELNYKSSQAEKKPGIKAEVWTCGKALEIPARES